MDTSVFERWESEIRGYCRAYPTVFVSASNARQVDEEGRSYIDFFAGAGALNFGHNNPDMKREMIAFLERDGVSQSLDMYTDVKRDFLEAFASTILEPRGWDYRMQFMGPTGSNAVEAAIKLARRVTGRQHAVAFSNGFHGMTLGALALTANDYFRGAAGVSLDNVVRLPFESVPGGGLDQLEAYRYALNDPSSGQLPPAAFVVEVVQAEGGVNVASAEWLQAVQALARDHGSLLIVDDIQAGMGRTGSFFSFDDLGIDPDIVVLAKGIGGYGTPLAMNLVKPEHDQHWKPGEHTGTFRGQGLSFVAGKVAIGYFADDALMDAVKDKGARMRERLQMLADKHHDRGFEVRGRGMMQALDVREGAFAKAVQQEAFENGLLFGPCGSGGRVCKLIPPLTIPEDDFDAGLDLFEQAVTTVAGR